MAHRLASAEAARVGFAEMKRVAQAARPWAPSIMALAIRFPHEPRTPEENLEIAGQTGERRLVLNSQTRLLLAEAIKKLH